LWFIKQDKKMAKVNHIQTMTDLLILFPGLIWARMKRSFLQSHLEVFPHEDSIFHETCCELEILDDIVEKGRPKNISLKNKEKEISIYLNAT